MRPPSSGRFLGPTTAGESSSYNATPLQGFSGVTRHMIQPGKAGDYHVHFDREQVYYFTEGSGKMNIDEVIYPVRKGDAVCVPSHQLPPHDQRHRRVARPPHHQRQARPRTAAGGEQEDHRRLQRARLQAAHCPPPLARQYAPRVTRRRPALVGLRRKGYPRSLLHRGPRRGRAEDHHPPPAATSFRPALTPTPTRSRSTSSPRVRER